METTPASARPAAPDHELVAAVAARAAGRPGVRLGSFEVRALDHRIENLTTARLDRVSGTLADGTSWSAVAKTLRPASASPRFAAIPEAFHEVVLRTLDWQDEPRVYRCGLAGELPAPFRMPVLLGVEDGPDRLTLWLEDVADTTPWDLDRYRRTAACLGRAAGRWPGDSASRRFGLAGRDIGTMFFGKVLHDDLPAQADDAFWSARPVRDVVGPSHRADLLRLADAVPAMVGALDRLPTGLCHGDATPDNFREPGDGTVVAIDWSYGHVGSLGSDLAQLLAGRFESGAAAEPVDAIAATILDAYAEGLAREGLEPEVADLERAWATHLAIRSVFSALRVEHRADLDDAARAELLVRRAALAKFGLELGLRHATARSR